MQVHEPPTLSFYMRPGRMTSAGRCASLFDDLPTEIAGLAAVGHGLIVHEFLGRLYGLALTDQDRETVHIRPVEDLLERIVARDARPLSTPRGAAGRIAGNCRQFTVLLVSMLRAQGTPARARCGFGGYFGDGNFEDHWVAEYWNAGQERWVLVDGQLDDRQRAFFPIDFDVTDVPRDRFLVAGAAWLRCRAGLDDPGRFGLSAIKEYGLWWIAGNLVRDAAALGNTEVLPWDTWGAMPGPQDVIDDATLALFDRLAQLTVAPDAALGELQRLCEDERLRVPATVRNELRDRDEAI